MCALFRGHDKACDATPRSPKYITDRRWRERNKAQVKANYERYFSYKPNRDKRNAYYKQWANENPEKVAYKNDRRA
jgi:hypothetical protein